jgi:hypothetical protein
MAKTATSRKAAAKKAAGKKAAAKATPKKAASKKAAPKAAARKAPAKKAAVRKMAPKKAAPKKAAPKKAAVKKTAPPKKTAAKKVATAKKAPAKKTAARVPAVRRPPTRRARAVVPAPRKVAVPPTRKAAAQHFTVSHLNEADFLADGLRSYALYRDLGVAKATGGLCQAHVIRLLSPPTDEVRKRHLHKVDLQLVYVLKGWVKNEFEGHGEQMMSAGSCWIQPSGIKHTVLDYSPDVELLEIVLPADFKTVELT